jgi:hypothetical protein
MLDECIRCPKPEHLKIICSKRDFPYNNSRVYYLNLYGECKERMKLIKKGGDIKK